MIGKTSRWLIASLGLAMVLVATSAGATTTSATTTTTTTTTAVPNGDAILTASFALASHKTSMTISGTLTGTGTTLTILGQYTPKASGGATTVKGVGFSDEV